MRTGENRSNSGTAGASTGDQCDHRANRGCTATRQSGRNPTATLPSVQQIEIVPARRQSLCPRSNQSRSGLQSSISASPIHCLASKSHCTTCFTGRYITRVWFRRQTCAVGRRVFAELRLRGLRRWARGSNCESSERLQGLPTGWA